MIRTYKISEAWDSISRYVYVALQGGSIMNGWTNDQKIMITCCNDATRLLIFKLKELKNNVKRCYPVNGVASFC